MPRRAAANVTNDRGPRRFLFFSALSKPQGKYATRALSDVVLLLGALRASAVKSDFLCVSASPRQRPAFHLGQSPNFKPRRFLFFSALSKPQGKYASCLPSDVALLLGAIGTSAITSHS